MSWMFFTQNYSMLSAILTDHKSERQLQLSCLRNLIIIQIGAINHNCSLIFDDCLCVNYSLRNVVLQFMAIFDKK